MGTILVPLLAHYRSSVPPVQAAHAEGLLSSKKTTRCGSSRMIGWRVEGHSSRACFMSGRSCWLARRVFFEAIANADEPPRKRGGGDLLAGGGGEFGRQLRHGDVGRLGDLLQKKRPMRFELGMAVPATGLGREASPHTKGLHQVDDKGNRHPEMRRSRAARMTFIGITKNPLTQIKRIRLRHRESPPFGTESRRSLRSS